MGDFRGVRWCRRAGVVGCHEGARAPPEGTEDNRGYHDKWTVDPQRSDSTGIAVARGHAEVLRLLMEHEGGMQDESGWTALTVAAYWNRLKCARLCAEKEKCIKTIRERFGCPPGTTALNIVRRKGYKEIVSILCE
ncbi:Beta-soluble NSF attachment protein [Giardia duodenalis assemblage B]|uniref:Beta-soluble NSF attachment protein n=1 Tax=Giardia duodenalis assemblage B TaxID=1394984 RepID=A0A132NLY1_GIAIN|nr:Beta-soluble NSF attachment protein [Giardia intestinalis assemblage B]